MIEIEEGLKILAMAFSIYAIVYCLFAIKMLAIYKEVQSREYEQIVKDAKRLNELDKETGRTTTHETSYRNQKTLKE